METVLESAVAAVGYGSEYPGTEVVFQWFRVFSLDTEFILGEILDRFNVGRGFSSVD
jgi:hypothetical protein